MTIQRAVHMEIVVISSAARDLIRTERGWVVHSLPARRARRGVSRLRLGLRRATTLEVVHCGVVHSRAQRAVHVAPLLSSRDSCLPERQRGISSVPSDEIPCLRSE